MTAVTSTWLSHTASFASTGANPPGPGPAIQDIDAQGLSHIAPIRMHPSKAIATGPRRTQSARAIITVIRRELIAAGIIIASGQGVKDSGHPRRAQPLESAEPSRWLRGPKLPKSTRIAFAVDVVCSPSPPHLI